MLKKISKFINEVKLELRKVSWSSREELIGSTLVVIIMVVLLSLFVGIIDLVLSRLVGFIVG